MKAKILKSFSSTFTLLMFCLFRRTRLKYLSPSLNNFGGTLYTFNHEKNSHDEYFFCGSSPHAAGIEVIKWVLFHNLFSFDQFSVFSYQSIFFILIWFFSVMLIYFLFFLMKYHSIEQDVDKTIKSGNVNLFLSFGKRKLRLIIILSYVSFIST